MIERAFGVCHGGQLIDGFGHHAGEYFILPSNGLSNELANLTKGSTVGIEFHPEIEGKFSIEGIEFDTSPSTIYYWNQIQNICNKNELQVVYLEDIQTYKKYLNEEVHIAKLFKQKESIEHPFEELSESKQITKSNNFFKKIIGIRREIYRHEVIRDYIHQVEREQQLFLNISKMNPTVVILGQEHTKSLIRSQKSICNDLGIQIRGYKFEMPRKFNRFEKFTTSDLVDYQNEPVNSPEMELTIRKYLAVTLGEILPNSNPDYVGSWDINIPERGLFEVYIKTKNEDSFSGIVEDVLGTARINGIISNKTIFFVKNYLLNRSSQNASKKELTFFGKKIGNYYKGDYSIEILNKCGEFLLYSNKIYQSDLQPSIITR